MTKPINKFIRQPRHVILALSFGPLLLAGCGGGNEPPDDGTPPDDTIPPPLTSEVPSPLAATVVDPTVIYQTHEGFGTSLAWFANVIGGWPDATRNEIADLLFDPIKGLGINIVRYNIGGGENPSHNHMRVGGEMDGFQPSEGVWDWSADANQRWVLQAAKQRAGDHFIAEAFSNSPPYWMTYSQCAAGNDPGSQNALISERYDDFADYLATVAEHFASQWGIEFDTIEPVNEPEADWWRAYNGQEGARFDANAQARIVDELAAALSRKQLDIAIAAMDAAGVGAALDNYAVYDNTTRSYIDQINTHGYHGTREEQNRLRNIAKQEGKRLWMSESDGGGGDEPFAEFTHNPNDIQPGLDLSRRIYSVLRDLQPDGWVFWQAVENWPNQVQINKNWGLILANMESSGSSSSEFRTTKKYSVMAQYSKHIRPGSVMIYVSDENAVAFLSPEGDYVTIVATNHGNTNQPFEVDLSRFSALPDIAKVYRTSANENYQTQVEAIIEDQVMSYNLPGRSVTTFVIEQTQHSDGRPFSGTYRLVNRNSDKCLTASSSNPQLTQISCTDDPQQRWKIEYQNAGQYTIEHASSGQAVGIANNGFEPAAGARLQQASGEDGQTWQVLPRGDGYFQFANLNSLYVLDISSASSQDGANAIQWHMNGGNNQLWSIEPWPEAGP